MLAFKCIILCYILKQILNYQEIYSKFGYGNNYKYEGQLSYSIDRYYAVAKLWLPKLDQTTRSKIGILGICIQSNHMYHLKSSICFY